MPMDSKRAMYTVSWLMHFGQWPTLTNDNVILNQCEVQGLENTKLMTQGSMQFMSNASIQLYNVNHHHPSKIPSVRVTSCLQ